MQHIKITTKGVKSALRSYNDYQAIAEYIWNGFDAKAKNIAISFEENDLGMVDDISIKDNGKGIPNGDLHLKFLPFYESEKEIEFGSSRNNSNTHGKNGVGRLTFFKFASQAIWETIYKTPEESKKYSIEISEDSLVEYNASKEQRSEKESGTIVNFYGVKNLFAKNLRSDLKKFLEKEFCWFLELHRNKKYSISLNDELVDYESLVGDRENIKFTHKETNTIFNIKYIRWNEKINKEYSKYYYLDSDGNERWKDNTKLNNKGDSFYHSLYIESDYFDNFNFSSKENPGQKGLTLNTYSDDEFKFLEEKLVSFLRKKRKPFLKARAEKLVQEYIKQDIIPSTENLSGWEKVRQKELVATIKGIYQVQPSIFYNFNSEQKKTMVGLLSLVIDSNEKDKILDIIQEIVELDQEERKELWSLLQTSKLTSVISTIKMIQKRQGVIEGLKELVFNKSLDANEIDHVQELVEENYWIFGEQYHLVTAAEPKFETALRKHHHLLTGENKKMKMEDPDKNKEMDIFICRRKIIDSKEHIENIVVELKSPKVPLGKKEYDQVENYMRTIKNEPLFNGKNSKWTFMLIGNRFTQDKTQSYIEGKIDSYKHLGKKSLALTDSALNYEVYAKTWSEIFNELEIKHEFLNEKLKMKKESLAPPKGSTADDIVEKAVSSK